MATDQDREFTRLLSKALGYEISPHINWRIACSTNPITERAIKKAREQMEKEGRKPAIICKRIK